MQRFSQLLIMLAVSAVIAGTALAASPENWQLGMQPPASPVKEAIEHLHNLLLVIISAVTVLVLVLLLYCIWRFRASRNPVPSRTSHSTPLEIAWTLIPVLILVVIAIPSFRLLYYEDRAREADLTINVTAFQWAWEYAYPDNGNFRFESYNVAESDLQPGQLRNLTVDNEIVVPVGRNVRILTTSRDVIHSFFIPALGVQKYAIPGRTMETWFRADRPGTYYGQCNQICGTNHAFMPVVVRAVSDAEFTAWAEQARTRFANSNENTATLTVAGMR